MTIDTGDIEESFSEHKTKLLGFCFRLLRDREAAEDVVQETFLTACQKQECERAWLYACARNSCLDILRRRTLWQKISDHWSSPVFEEGFEASLVQRQLGWKILSQLPPKMRDVLVLKSYAGLSYDELAEVFGTSANSVGVMLNRARKKAGQILDKESKL